MSDPSFSRRSNTFLATTSASLGLKRCALAIVTALSVVFCALIPFARIPLPRFEAFIPIFETGLALNSLLTASLLVAGFRRSQLCAVLCLASGYLFTSLMVVPLALTSTGVFPNSTALSAASQTRAWLDAFRNTGFPIFAICYALLRRYEGSSGRSSGGTRANIIWAATGTIAGVCLLTLVATAGHQLLPPMMLGDGYTTAMVAANVPAWLLCLVALAVLGSRPPYSILDLWLMVVVFGARRLPGSPPSSATTASGRPGSPLTSKTAARWRRPPRWDPESVYDAISARIAEDLGFEVGLFSGSIGSMSVLGAPDLVVLTLTEFAGQAYRICRAGYLALLVDADHGYGNALNVRRPTTVSPALSCRSRSSRNTLSGR